jgi:peptide chain release factor 3
MYNIKEINKRRTMAIVSHPDAGKTTLTEKFLLFGGAIQTAGAVKSNKIKKTATSDFMDIERQRGISVATSVMSFDYNDTIINLLDTPGHKDFAEDTYRTLTAVDGVIMVVDSVKGVEEQTERLMEVCRMRATPVIVFVNKLDREGKDPFELLDEIEDKLTINVRPLTWPVSKGGGFKGVYNLYNKSFDLFRPNKTQIDEDTITVESLDNELLSGRIGQDNVVKLKEDIAMVEGVYEPFERETYLSGELAPVFFGSAINNFGVRELLDTCIEIMPTPKSRATDERIVEPDEKDFSGFIFKIHANLDPKHRDRIAFLRICSGKFERNKFFHHVRLDKQLRFSSPATFMARSKSIVDEAYPGDVIGLYDTGNFKIGDTLTDGEKLNFKGIPSFSPEIFKELVNLDPMKSKQLDKGIRQLTDEGVAQLFSNTLGNRKIVGTVGELQFDVIQYRLQNEYGAACKFTVLNFCKACWITCDDKDKLDDFARLKYENVSIDKEGNFVYFAESEWMLKRTMDNNPDIHFHFTSEH